MLLYQDISFNLDFVWFSFCEFYLAWALSDLLFTKGTMVLKYVFAYVFFLIKTLWQCERIIVGIPGSHVKGIAVVTTKTHQPMWGMY